MEVERAMSSELQALKQELQLKGGQNRPQDEEVLSAMREQVNNYSTKLELIPQRFEVNVFQVQVRPRRACFTSYIFSFSF